MSSKIFVPTDGSRTAHKREMDAVDLAVHRSASHLKESSHGRNYHQDDGTS